MLLLPQSKRLSDASRLDFEKPIWFGSGIGRLDWCFSLQNRTLEVFSV